ncbi:MAG: signal peptidase I [Spirochaetaceae bacterium]|jgi:signal peptidase I|nr:signal peptidase I [Spirochaetaceae bacterium]
MFTRWRKYSYTDRRIGNLKKLKALLWVGIFFSAYAIITSFVIILCDLENQSMTPEFKSGERFTFLSFGIKRAIPQLPILNPLPLERGDVVLIKMKSQENQSFFLTVADKFCRFLTFGRLGLHEGIERNFLKRVIATPGDEISMSNFVMRVKPANGSFTFTEFELSEKLYTINIPEIPPLWDQSIPFSGNVEQTVLGEGMYYLLSDNRSNTNDSRTWGPVHARNIAGKLLFRYWPIIRFGKV